MADRLVRRVPKEAPPVDGFQPLAFPTAPQLSAIGMDALRGIGLTGAKAGPCSPSRAAVADGALDWARLRRAPPEAAGHARGARPGRSWTRRLTEVRGIWCSPTRPRPDDRACARSVASALREARGGGGQSSAPSATAPATASRAPALAP